MGEGKEAIRTTGERAAPIALVALIATVCLANLEWIHRSNLLQYHLDARWLVALVLNAADAIAENGMGAVPEALGSLSMGGRPPLYAILGLPFVLVFGPREDAALLVNVGFEATLLAATFAVGRRCGTPWVGLLAAFLVACYPPIVHLSRIFTPHFALPACVALWLWRLLWLLDARSVAASWWLCASVAFGLMIHPSFAWTAAVPTAFVCVHVGFGDVWRESASTASLRSRLWGSVSAPLMRSGLIPGTSAIALVMIAWYAHGGARLLETFQSFDEIPEFAIRGFEGVSPGVGWYGFTSPGALSIFFAGLLLLATLRAAFVADLRVRVLALAFVSAYALINLQPARAWWYLSAALPIAACLSALFVREVGNRLLSTTLTACCVTVGAFTFATVSWGMAAWSEPIARALGAPLGTETCRIPGNMVFCPNPPQRVDWKAAEMLAAIQSGGSCQPPPCRLLLVQPALFPRSILTDELSRARSAPGPSIHEGMGDGGKELRRSDFLIHVEPAPSRFSTLDLLGWKQLIDPLHGRHPVLLGSWRLPNGSVARLVRLERSQGRHQSP